MQRFASIADVFPLRRALTSLKVQTLERISLFKHMRFISQQDQLYNQMENAGKYSDQLSYCYRPFDLTSPHALHLFSFYSDRSLGGESSGSLIFDHQEKTLVLEGTISEKEKEKLVMFPSIGMARTHPFPIRCGPFNALSIQLESDGLPIHMGVEVHSPLSGVVSCYGVITSKIKGWRTYELPFANMILVGTQDHQHLHTPEPQLSTSKDGTLIGSTQTDMRRIIMTQTDQVVIRDINLRLLGSKTAIRRVAVRNLGVVEAVYSWASSEKFMREYLHPFFFMVDQDPYILQPEVGVSWLTKGYQDFKAIDLGDKKYLRKDTPKRAK